jgi:hypothetical protein
LIRHLDQYCHCQSHLTIFDFASCFVSQGGHESDDSCKMTSL